MRDLERWKDKVELSLDGRQIFFLFFGSAVAACVIFVAGVAIGKRIEQHTMTAAVAAPEDPLAALDRLGDGDGAGDGLTYHEALARGRRALPTRKAAARDGGNAIRPATASAASPRAAQTQSARQ